MIYQKTPFAKNELQKETIRVSHLARVMLFLVDGKLSDTDIKRNLNNPDGFDAALEELIRFGLIEKLNGILPDSVKQPQSLKIQLFELIRGKIPTMADRFWDKLQTAPDDPDALQVTLESCCKVIKLTIDEKKANQIREEGLALIKSQLTV